MRTYRACHPPTILGHEAAMESRERERVGRRPTMGEAVFGNAHVLIWN